MLDKKKEEEEPRTESTMENGERDLEKEAKLALLKGIIIVFVDITLLIID